MTRKTTKRAMLFSVLALVLCMSMFVGTTYAWFTDSVTSANNKIVAGNLKVDLELLEKDGSWTSIKDSNAPIFNYSNWEPGYVDVKVLNIVNEGSLALKWKAVFVADTALSELANVIDVYVKPGVSAYPTDRVDLSTWENVGTVAEFIKTIETTTYGTLEKDENAYLGIALKMQESAGNQYQGMDMGAFDIMIVATQKASEADSFGPDYDDKALYPAVVRTSAEMEEAIASGAQEVFLAAKVDFNAVRAGSDRDLGGVTITGIDEDAAIVAQGTGGGYANVNLVNIAVIDETCYTSENGEGAWEFTYLEFSGKNTFKNVEFTDGVMLDGDNTFENCVFMGHNNDSSTNATGTKMYGAWVNSGNATFTNCTFIGTRGLKVHECYGSDIYAVVADGCTFGPLSEKPGVVIGDVHMAGETGSYGNTSWTDSSDTLITVKNSTFTNVQAGDQGEYYYESDTTVGTWLVLENNSLDLFEIDDTAKTAVISSAADMFTFAKMVNEDGKSFSGYTVSLAADIDLGNKEWAPIGQTGATEFRGIFDGNDYTIKNLYIDSSEHTDEHYSSGLFGWAERGVTIKNVKVDGAKVTGNHNVAVIVGYTYSGVISNCHVSNAEVVCNHANGDACGDKAGIIAGYTADEARLFDCSATDCTVTAGRDAGQLFGFAYNVSVSNCTATNVVVSATGDCNREGNINNAVIGRVMG